MKNRNYWNEDTILSELKEIIQNTRKFLTYKELILCGRNDIVHAILRHGGINKYRVLLGYNVIKKNIGYWTEDNTIKELKEYINKNNCFPIFRKIKDTEYHKIITGIQRNGGVNKFRRLLVFKELKQDSGYWTFDILKESIINIIKNIGYFPSFSELMSMNKYDIIFGMSLYGGIRKIRADMGYSISNYSTYISSKNAYILNRGKKQKN